MIFQKYVCALEAYICLLICSHCIRWRNKFDRIVLDLCVYHTFAIGFYFYTTAWLRLLKKFAYPQAIF